MDRCSNILICAKIMLILTSIMEFKIPMTDQNLSIQELKDKIKNFVQERDWDQYHSPKNLSMSLAIEVAELMEHFQWLTIEQSKELVLYIAILIFLTILPQRFV